MNEKTAVKVNRFGKFNVIIHIFTKIIIIFKQHYIFDNLIFKN